MIELVWKDEDCDFVGEIQNGMKNKHETLIHIKSISSIENMVGDKENPSKQEQNLAKMFYRLFFGF